MADVFRRFISNLTSTDLTTVFTVPTANVAATPPVPVSTFIVKSINTHNYDGSSAVTVNIDHNDGSSDFQIFQVDVAASNTNTCLLYTSPSPRDLSTSRMPSSA